MVFFIVSHRRHRLQGRGRLIFMSCSLVGPIQLDIRLVNRCLLSLPSVKRIGVESADEC